MRTIALSVGASVLVAAIFLGCSAGDDELVEDRASDPVTRALADLARHPETVNADADHAFQMRDIMIDDDGSEHVRFARTYAGLRVVGGDVVTHRRSGAFEAPSRTLRAPIAVDLEPRIEPAAAIHEAQRVANGPDNGGDAELVIDARRGAPVLAYEVVIRTEPEDSAPSELHVLVDAKTGSARGVWDAVESTQGTGNGLYAGTVAITSKKEGANHYLLVDGGRGKESTVDAKNKAGSADALFVSANDIWGDGALTNRQTTAVDAHYAMAETWDYFHLVHGRKGIAGDGVGIVARVHFGKDYANAVYDPTSHCVDLGDGKKGIAPGHDLLPLASLDIVGHEVSHGVAANTAALLYEGEAGALNEATSDIFGTMIERRADNPNDPPDYLIGEELFSPKGRAFRSLAYPEKDGSSVGCYRDNAGALDVHFASGIPNHFFYLLAEGTTAETHTCGTGASFEGIGAERAAKIWYRALTVYFTSAEQMSDAHFATLDAAKDLYGIESVEYARVEAAWAAVLVD